MLMYQYSSFKEVGKLFSKKHRQHFFERKALRYSRIGLAQEEYVKSVLEKAKENGDFIKVEKHLRHSTEDNDGKDFTVTKKINGNEISISFGITISPKRKNRSRLLHPDICQFCFPVVTKPETIIKAVNKLFFAAR